MSESEIYFEVSVELSWGNVETRKIGPYSEDDLNEHGQPPEDEVEMAVWDIIDQRVGVQRVE